MTSINDERITEIYTKLTKLTNRYIEENPIVAPVYRISLENNFHRNHKFRYELFFEKKYPESKIGSWVCNWGRLKCEPNQIFDFYINPHSPTIIKINQQIVYKSGLIAENRRNEAEYFRYTAKNETELSIQIISQKTKIGWGCEFGSARIKSNPIYVTGPTKERKEIEGFVHTSPQESWMNYPYQLDDPEEKYFFQPRLNWTDEEKKLPLIKRLGGEPDQYFYGIFSTTFLESKEYFFSCNYPKAHFYLDGKKIENKTNLFVKQGSYDVVVIFKDEGNYLNQLLVHIAHNNETITLKSAFSDSFPVISYLGPFSSLEHSLPEVISKRNVVQNRFWKLDAPAQTMRIFLTSSLFGQWNYPLGVTLRGLYTYAKQFHREDVARYVKEHIELCTTHYEYALWDTKHFGAPEINKNIVLIDSLDDCGSFGRAILEVLKYDDVAESERVLADIATYIMEKQGRQPNGMLYRVNAHMSLMENTAWADDTYMSVPFLVAYSQYKKAPKYLKEAQQQLLWSIQYLWQPDKRLFGHVYNFEWQTSNDIPWGRGNGWVLLSLTETLLHTSEKAEEYDMLKQVYQSFIQEILELIGPNAMWHQLLDDTDSYEETSCSAIILFNLGIALRENWLENPNKELLSILSNSWESLSSKMIDEDGNLHGVCKGSGYSFSRDYYKFELGTKVNDTHGIGIVLMAGCEVLKQRRGEPNENT